MNHLAAKSDEELAGAIGPGFSVQSIPSPTVFNGPPLALGESFSIWKGF